jgi:hypothetical protein
VKRLRISVIENVDPTVLFDGRVHT